MKHRLSLATLVLTVLASTLSGAPAAAFAPPGPVRNLRVTDKSSTSVSLAWDVPAFAESLIVDYKVEFMPTQGNWTEFVHTASTSTTITVTGLNFNTPYMFRVSAIQDDLQLSEPAIASYAAVEANALSSGGGDQSGCELLVDGSIQCFGSNASFYGSLGMLGNGTSTRSDIPVLTLMPEKAIDLSAGPNGSCAIGESKNVYCWGRAFGTYGGVGAAGTSFVPTLQPGISNAKIVAVGSHGRYNDVSIACVVTEANHAYCWGAGDSGQLGNGEIRGVVLVSAWANATQPVMVSEPAGIGYTDVATSGLSTCLIGTDTHLYCTGDNSFGQLGVGLPTTPTLVPTEVVMADGTPLTGVTDISLGGSSTCAVAGGDVYCWGGNAYGQLGTGDTTSYYHPQLISGGWSGSQVAISDGSGCAITTLATLKCWGSQVNNGTGVSSTLVPLDASPSSRTYSSINAGSGSLCAVSLAGTPYCFGWNNSGLGYVGPQLSGIQNSIDPWVSTLNTAPPSNLLLSLISGSVGATVTVSGDNLTAVTRLQFGGQSTAFSEANGTLLFRVPVWSQVGTSYSIRVTSAGGSATAPTDFVVTQSPIVSINLTVTTSDGTLPLLGGSYSWTSQGRFSPSAPTAGNDTGTVTLTNVVSGPGTISISGGTLPDGRTVSGSWTVDLQPGTLTLDATPTPAPPTVSVGAYVLFPDGTPVPGASLTASGLSNSYVDATANRALTYFLPSAVTQATTDVDGLALLYGYQTSPIILGTATYDDSVLRQSSQPKVLLTDGTNGEITLTYMPILTTSSDTLSATAGDVVTVDFLNTNNGVAVPNQDVVITEVSVTAPAAAPARSTLAAATCPTTFSGRTNSAGLVSIPLCTAVSGLHRYVVTSPGAVRQFLTLSLNVQTIAVATSFSLTGPAAGIVGRQSNNFVVAPDGLFSGTVSVSVVGGGLNYSLPLTYTNSALPQTFTITPVAEGAVSVSISTSPVLILPSALTYQSTPPPATSYTFTGPSSGAVNNASGTFTVTPNGIYTGSVRIVVTGGGLNSVVQLTFSASRQSQSFTITPTGTGTVILSPSSMPLLTNAAAKTYASLPAGLTPTFSAPTAASTGFSVNVVNYNASYRWTFSTSAGTLTRGTPAGSTLLVTISGLSAGQSAVVTASTSRTGYAGASASAAGSAISLLPALISTFSTPVRNSSGFTVNVSNYSAAYTYTITTSAGTLTRGIAAGATLPLTVAGLTSGQAATVTVVTTRTGFASGTSTVASSALVTPAPTITSFTPTSAAAGATVTITGTNLTGASMVKLGVKAVQSFTVVSATSITFVVPTGAATGTVSVTTAGGTATSTASLTFSNPAPTITSFAATTGGRGLGVTITGTNFTRATSVTFGGVATTAFRVVSATSIVVGVPTSAVTGRITVVTPAGTATSATNFTVTATATVPTVTAFTATTGGRGLGVTITGTNLAGATAVTFNGVAARFTVLSNTSILASVPTTATGRIVVTTAGGTATSATNFTYTTAISLPTITSFSSTYGSVGGTVTITGTNLAGVTGVAINGVAVTNIRIVSATSIQIIVPTGATTGLIAVTTVNGTATSSGTFMVV